MDEVDLDEFPDDQVERIAEQYAARKAAENEEARSARIAKERAKLEEELTAGIFQTQKARVALILSQYPATRNSDITLALKYWEVFQGDVYRKDELRPIDLFKLERYTTIARLRAKIQHDYGLYLANEDVQRRRRGKAAEFKEEMISDGGRAEGVQVFVDESGSNGKGYLVVASIWLSSPAQSLFFQNAVNKYRDENKVKFEFHVSAFKKGQLDHYKAFIDIASSFAGYMSLKAVVMNTHGVAQKIDEALRDLLSIVITKGYLDEVNSKRITPPRRISVTVDKSTHWSGAIRVRTAEHAGLIVENTVGEGNTVDDIREADSKVSPVLQLADLFAWSVNRRLNERKDGGEPNPKDQLADYFFERLAPECGEAPEGDDNGDNLRIIDLK